VAPYCARCFPEAGKWKPLFTQAIFISSNGNEDSSCAGLGARIHAVIAGCGSRNVYREKVTGGAGWLVLASRAGFPKQRLAAGDCR